MITTLVLPKPLGAQLCAEARSAFPRECCGLIEGVKDSLTLSAVPRFNRGKGEAIALHATRNLSSARDRFEIDPAAHIALSRGLRGTERAIIGCYHSHPNGRPEPSEYDRESASQPDFLWLIASLDSAAAEPHLAAFVSTGAGFAPARIEVR